VNCPFDLAQGGGELVEPFVICVLLFDIFLLKPETRHLKPPIVPTPDTYTLNPFFLTPTLILKSFLFNLEP
jgi:hypothetical protein